MIRQLCACSLLLLVAACSGDLSGLDSASGLMLEASVSSTSIQDGQADTITVTLTNTNPVPVILHFGSGCQILPYVANATGGVVAPDRGSWSCTTALSSRRLEAHEVQTVTFVWSGSTDLSPAILPRTLPRGLYYVFATLDSYEVQLTTDRVAVYLE